jgi:hypothetical protein
MFPSVSRTRAIRPYWPVTLSFDIDGIVVIPEEHAEAVIGVVKTVMNAENLVRKAIS